MNPREQAGRFSELVRDSLDQSASPALLARQAAHSRSSFFRLFQALLAESPGSMRRRFLLERAAWEMGRTAKPVTDIALDAGFSSLEAFSRAFHKAYRMPPTLYRRTGTRLIHLPAPNEFHFGGPLTGHPLQGDTMDLYDLFAGTETWYTRRLLDAASSLTDEQLDKPVHTTFPVFGWQTPDQNLREILERMVLTKEVWTAALTNGPMPSLENPAPSERTPTALLARFEKADAEFTRIFCEIRRRGAWNETFVDALCEPPETFTFGGMFAHIITFNAQRRLSALDALHRLGVPLSGVGCPMEYEASLR
jgi:AraC-like DNA-binding protein